MENKNMNKIKKVLLLAFVALFAQTAVASDVEELTGMLHDFLANSDKEAAHERFWADDLVYSSSAGLRFGKADIMSGFDSAPEEEGDTPPEVVYSGEEVDVRLYGDTAIVAFKLVGTPTDEGAATGMLYYYNTGTFLKRGGVWKAVAWQATKIPPE
jgi:hypothetical protein